MATPYDNMWLSQYDAEAERRRREEEERRRAKQSGMSTMLGKGLEEKAFGGPPVGAPQRELEAQRASGLPFGMDIPIAETPQRTRETGREVVSKGVMDTQQIPSWRVSGSELPYDFYAEQNRAFLETERIKREREARAGKEQYQEGAYGYGTGFRGTPELEAMSRGMYDPTFQATDEDFSGPLQPWQSQSLEEHKAAKGYMTLEERAEQDKAEIARIREEAAARGERLIEVRYDSPEEFALAREAKRKLAAGLPLTVQERAALDKEEIANLKEQEALEVVYDSPQELALAKEAKKKVSQGQALTLAEQVALDKEEIARMRAEGPVETQDRKESIEDVRKRLNMPDANIFDPPSKKEVEVSPYFQSKEDKTRPAGTEDVEGFVQGVDTMARGAAAGGVGGVDFAGAYDALQKAGEGDLTARLPESVIEAASSVDWQGKPKTPDANAIDLVQRFNRILAGESPEQMQLDLAQMETDRAMAIQEEARAGAREIQAAQGQVQRDVADLQAETASQRIEADLGMAKDQDDTARYALELEDTRARVERDWKFHQNNFDRNLQRDLADGTNQTQENVATTYADATRFVASENRLSAEEVALINSSSTIEAAEVTGMSRIRVEEIKSAWAQRIAEEANISVAQVNAANNAAMQANAREQIASAENIASWSNTSAQNIATITGSNALEVAQAQNAAAVILAEKNNTSVETVTQLQVTGAYDLAQMQMSGQFSNESAILTLQNDFQKELATLLNTTPERIAQGQNQAGLDLEAMRIQGQKDYLSEQQTFEAAQAQLQREATADVAKTQFLAGLTPAEYSELQKDISRGGMSVEESVSLSALVARGGLTPEQRLTELTAETRSSEMSALMSLLSNPSALGAFVTAISGELPFEAVPTMSQLVDMTPNRIQYLQGALSAMGIDPQVFIRMAQDVTPQAFQEAGPFGQLSAMVA